MSQLPNKLKKDAIVEALVELRFETTEMPEIILGRLTDNPVWRSFERNRTAIAELPSAIRLSDLNLRFQPQFDLRELNGLRNVKIGTNVLSFHILKNYCGWDEFRPQIEDMVDFLFERIAQVSVRRIGLRYINCLTKKDHMIGGVEDLELKIEISGNTLKSNMNLNYLSSTEASSRTMVRIASRDFVDGLLPSDTTAYIDIDVFTADSFHATSAKQVIDWIKAAHDVEKRAFFQLLPQSIVDGLKES